MLRVASFLRRCNALREWLMQTYFVVAIVGLAAGYMLLRLLRRLGVVKGAAGCGCGCESCGPVNRPGGDFGTASESDAHPHALAGRCSGCASGRNCCGEHPDTLRLSTGSGVKGQ